MELTLKINLGEQADPELINRLLSTARTLDEPPYFRKTVVGDVSLTEYPASTSEVQTAAQAYHDMAEATDGAEQQQEDAVAEPSGGKGSTKKGSRGPGRPPKAETDAKKAAEAAAAKMVADAQAAMQPAAEEQISQPVQQVQPQQTNVVTLPPGVAASGHPVVQKPVAAGNMTLPPGVAQPQAQPQVVQQQPVVVEQTPAALPAVVTESLPQGDGEIVPLDIFKAEYQTINARLPGKLFTYLKATTWPDGTPKEMWFTADGVPPEFRMKLLEIWSTLG